jgi:transcriptional regulator with XRE-family HTH domain
MSFDFLSSKTRRHAFVAAFIRQGVSMQIQLLRKREKWSQKKLGEITEKKQNAITRLEDPSYGKFTITTLLELAKAFDVALSVRFISFSELEQQSQNLSPNSLCVARFDDEMPTAVASLPKAMQIQTTASTAAPVTLRNITGFRMKRGPTPTSAGLSQITGGI